jgi:hypothetical protein
MTNSTLMTLSSRALQLATLFLVAAPVTFGGEPAAADRESQLIGHIVVTAPREVPFIGSLVVTATRSPVVLVADLGSMTVTADREALLVTNLGEMTVTAERESVQVADLGEMTVTAGRPITVARNDKSQAARLSLRIPDVIPTLFVEVRGKVAKAATTSRVRPGK